MRQARLMWPAFALAVAVVLAAMAWITAAVLRLDAAEAESRRRAQLEENVRLALWRMDSALAPLIAAEHARPANAYRTNRAAAPAERLTPPPLPGTTDHFARVYFEIGPRETWVAQVPGSDRTDSAAAIAALRDIAPRDELLASLQPPGAPGEPSPVSVATTDEGQSQAGRNRSELQARAANTVQQQLAVQNAIQQVAAPAAGSPALLQPLWREGQLLLARRVMSGTEERVQGCWVDWPAVRRWLLDSFRDLLPSADLAPIAPGATDPEARMLASLPVRLVPGHLPPAAADGRTTSPLRVSLVVAWACVLLATGAVAVLLGGVVSLSERRGAFVSAVTHELRTPLTTLRMYTEMLAEGMVADDGQRRSYLQTLRAEADRLGHLVENVLAYSRLERNRAGYEPAVVKLCHILGRAIERLGERARQAGMELSTDVPAEVSTLNVRTNPLALEQILFNLVDNACKYAAGAAEKRIELTATASDDRIRLSVRDHGPGIPAPHAARLFIAFSKSVKEAADTAPGLGLGLALSRRLARSMGGDLWLDSGVSGGAVFVVELPRA